MATFENKTPLQPVPSPTLPRSDSSSEGSQSYFNSALDLTESVSLSAFPESSVIEKFTTLLTAFAFERAKELVTKQMSQKNTDHLLNSFLLVLSNLSNTERQYMNLSFLAPKGFLRKDCNLRGSLEHIKQELKKFSESEQSKYSSELLFFVSMRINLIDFYEKLSLLGSAKNVEIIDLISELELISEKFVDGKRAFVENTIELTCIFCSLGWEIGILSNLLKSHVSMQNWEFFVSIMAIQDAQKCLSEWSEFIQQKQYTRKSSFLSPVSASPVLYLWLFKLKATLLSKFSLYFYEILVKNSNPAYDIQTVSAKLETDYFSKINSFVKKSEALCVCLIFDARDVPFHPNGYQHPARPTASPKGLESFPAVLAVPTKPSTYWPSVVMLISERVAELDADKLVGFYDSSTKVQATFFLLRIDSKMHMLTVFESKKSEKDSYVLKFMQEMATDLKCGKIFANLKHSAK